MVSGMFKAAKMKDEIQRLSRMVPKYITVF
jgi:hypothetical protein